ncbi:TonB-dependent receptor [Flavobacterium jejuense]|uniref:TonB-dependent receptor n=1 Tax=Flavobacterium jejuense TaxID=1544455 RepID=A0ABX0IVP7_9FLAO|nr:outer membrane beta-barrel family protein [Flavobacterium jejuense]NHN27543.1 TonB-dependent receptor [Flavobacterium jejuense]
MLKRLQIFALFLFTTMVLAQKPDVKKIKISGKIFEKGTTLPLEYATVVFQDAKNPERLNGGVTDLNGNFSFEVTAGTYNVRFEYISFKTVEVKNTTYNTNTDFGTIYLEADIAQLAGVEVIAERSTVEIKLDKRVYNVGKDMMVKGGTVSDVLDNVPSVTVDPEGTVALRGNENVKILIDGKPSGLAGINIADALKMLPADAVEKVEVITNPSARYDAEGGGGIINIILRKGKAQGLNGSFVLSAGNPETYGANSSLNYRSEKFNLFSNIGYNYRTSKGNSLTNSEYISASANPNSIFLDERRTNERLNKGYNSNFGIELFLDKTTTWTNSLTIQNRRGENPDNVFFYNFDANRNPTFTQNRLNDEKSKDFTFEYATNFTKNFKKEDHKLTVDMSFSQNRDKENSIIYDQIIGEPNSFFTERTLNPQNQSRNLFQTDYVLPIGEKSRFEAGYRGSFQKNLTDFEIDALDASGNWVRNDIYSNLLEYKENVNALYMQYGSKINKFSYFFGVRFEDSNIEVNSISANDYNTKKYNNFFPTATLNYEFSETSSMSLSYSKRINRPRGRFLNPFSSYSSRINIFRGNPDLNPAYTNAFDLGYLKRWTKVTFNTSAYINMTDDSFQFIRRESGLFVEGVPVIESTPINLATEIRAGFEFNVNYSPFKWWKLNNNFNLFRNETKGDYSYTNSLNELVVQNFDNTATSWFTRISSKISLPYKIDWQTNATYYAPQNSAQGKRYSMTSVNLAFSKDVLKDKATIALNVSDLFNSRKRRSEVNLPTVNSYSEFQWRQRQINLSFTYRFNKKKNERDNQRRGDDGGGDEFMG